MGLRHMGVGSETTWNTAATRTRFFEALSESVRTEKAFENIEVIRGYSTREVVLLNSAVRGDAEILANYDGIGILLKNLIGSVDTTGSDPYTHTFPASTGIPAADRVGESLTMEFRRDNSLVWIYPGAKITAMNHTFGTDQSSRMSFTFLAGSETTATSATTASYETLRPMKPSQVSALFDGTTLSASSVSINVENPLDEPFLLGATTLGAEPDRSAVLAVSASIEVLFSDFTQYNKYGSGADVDVAITATDSTHSITYNLNKCRLTQATPALQGRERLRATYELTSFYNTDATENIQIVLRNTNSTA